jgi:hypothetical protein
MKIFRNFSEFFGDFFSPETVGRNLKKMKNILEHFLGRGYQKT